MAINVEALPTELAVFIIEKEIQWNRILKEQNKYYSLREQGNNGLAKLAKFSTLNLLLMFNTRYQTKRTLMF